MVIKKSRFIFLLSLVILLIANGRALAVGYYCEMDSTEYTCKERDGEVLSGGYVNLTECEKECNNINDLKLSQKILDGNFKQLGGGDINLTQLTPEVAKQLLENSRESGVYGTYGKYGVSTIHMDKLTSLSRESAEILAQLKVSTISLRGLQSISPEVARELAKFEGDTFYLNGLISISDEAAKELAGFKGKGIYFDNGHVFMSKESSKTLKKITKSTHSSDIIGNIISIVLRGIVYGFYPMTVTLLPVSLFLSFIIKKPR
jgi:hypothetical protein